MATANAVGIDIGGGSTKIGVVSEDGRILARKRLVLPAAASGSEIVELYAGAVADLIAPAAGSTLAGIGIGFPGHIHPGRESGASCNIPALDHFPIARTLEDRFSCRVQLENDADAAAVAEHRVGAGRSARRLLMITVGTGIGVAFLVDGKPLETAHGCLGDAGHMLLVSDDPQPCRQGCLGCLESVASGHALDRRAKCLHAQGLGGGAAHDAFSLLQDALAGDVLARQEIQAAGRWIGMAAASWCHIFAPTAILVGGGLSAAGPLLIDPIRDGIHRRGMRPITADLEIRPASLGNHAGIIGAAAQVMPRVLAASG